MTTIYKQALVIGDQWSIVVPVTNADGTPVNFTLQGLTPAAEFWNGTSPTPADLTVGNSGIVGVDSTAGKFTVAIPYVLSEAAVPQRLNAISFPTRVQVYVTDVDGNRTTLGIIQIVPQDPLTA